MIEEVLYGEKDPVRNYWSWMWEGGTFRQLMKNIWTGLWVTALITFHIVETGMILVLGWAFREIYLGAKAGNKPI